MQLQFWNSAGQKKWPLRHPEKIFLGEAFLRLGKLVYKDEWPCLDELPSDDQIDALRKQIATAAASGALRTYFLLRLDGFYEEIPQEAWRNTGTLVARFSRCQIDPKDFNNSAAAGKNHAFIFVDIGDFEILLAKTDASFLPTELPTAKDPAFISPYLRFALHIATTSRLDEEKLPSAKELRRTLQTEWKNWRPKLSGTGLMPEHAVLSDRMTNAMVSMLRGEKARNSRGGGGVKT